MPDDSASPIFDVVIIGGGINGCGIARDLAGRGLKVALLEMADLAQATSSSSTKLFHGGLRYLEYYEFRLVRESLIEREVLLRAMPHIAWPLRFILPHHKGLRPAWLLRLGLFIYDHLGGRKILPGTKSVNLRQNPVGTPLKGSYKRAFEYSDCWVEDSRLVVLNARDAADRGAEIYPRTRCEKADRQGDIWTVTGRSEEDGSAISLRTRAVVNAGGPWVDDILNHCIQRNAQKRIRLVRGSHIVVNKLHDHDRAYIFQQSDGRIVFAIPYETDFTLIGTTDVDHDADAGTATCTPEEAAYLCEAVSEYFDKPVTTDDIVWTYSGVRPLYDDGASSATAATRDYVLEVDAPDNTAPALSVFGGKITTYRRLSEEVCGKLAPFFPSMGDGWTAGKPLPGGDFAVDGVDALVADLSRRYGFLENRQTKRLVRAYGTQAAEMLGDAKDASDLGTDFGAGLTQREVEWLMEREWARTAEDIVWRRSKLGLRLTSEQIETLDRWMASHLANQPRPAAYV